MKTGFTAEFPECSGSEPVAQITFIKAGMFSAKAAQVIGGLGSLETMDFDNFCASFRKEGRVNPLDEIFADADDAKMARRLGIPVFDTG